MIEPFLKEGAGFNPMFARMKIVTINTSTSYRRRGMMNATENIYAMHDKMCLSTDTRVRKTALSYLQCIGYHGSFAAITMVPNAL